MSYLMDLRKVIGSRPIIACGACVAIFNHENKLLLQKRIDNNSWGLIGGFMELGETIAETAKREVLEEVGIILEDMCFYKVFSGRDFYYKYPNGDEVYNVVNVFTARLSQSGEFELDKKEVLEAKYFSFDELPANISPPDVKIVKELVSNCKIY